MLRCRTNLCSLVFISLLNESGQVILSSGASSLYFSSQNDASPGPSTSFPLYIFLLSSSISPCFSFQPQPPYWWQGANAHFNVRTAETKTISVTRSQSIQKEITRTEKTWRTQRRVQAPPHGQLVPPSQLRFNWLLFKYLLCSSIRFRSSAYLISSVYYFSLHCTFTIWRRLLRSLENVTPWF